MAFEHKPGSFSLFKNDKGGNDQRPDYRGEGKDLDGNAIELAAWIRRVEGKTPFMACTFKLKGEPAAKPAAKPAAQSDGGIAGMDDDIPF